MLTRGVNLHFIAPSKPMQNAYIESFNGKFRDECLSQHWFVSLEEARSLSEPWGWITTSDGRTGVYSI